MSDEQEDYTRSFITRSDIDKEAAWEINKKKIEKPGYVYIRHTSDEYVSGIRNASDGVAWGASQLNLKDLKDAVGAGGDYDDTAIQRELAAQSQKITQNASDIADLDANKADADHTHDDAVGGDHNHDNAYQPKGDYATKTDLSTGLAGKANDPHTHDYAEDDHNHDKDYQPKGNYAENIHEHAEYETKEDASAAHFEITKSLSGKSDDTHNHDGTYATFAHTHNDLAVDDHSHDEYQPKGDYADSTHLHTEYAETGDIAELTAAIEEEAKDRANADSILQDQLDALDLDELDSRYLQLSGGEMLGAAKIAVNRIGPTEGTGMTVYEGQSFNHPNSLTTSGYLREYAAEKEHEHDIPPGVIVSDEEPQPEPDEEIEEGTLWYDTDRLEMFIFYDGGWITTNALGARIDEGEEIQKELQARVAIGEEQQVILQHKVRALEGSIGEHPFAFSMNSIPRDGQMVMMGAGQTPTNVVADVRYILFSTVDYDGNSVDLGVLGEGDLLRVASPDGGTVEFKSASEASNDQFIVESVFRSDFDEFTADVVYGSTYLSQFDPSGLATINYVDDQLKGKSNTNHSHSDYLTKKGEQNGTGYDWKLRVLHTDGGGGRQTYIDIHDDKLYLYHLADPSHPEHPTNMKYVDEQTAALGESIDAGLEKKLDAMNGVHTHRLAMKGNAEIDGSTSSMLSGRATMVLRTDNEKPIAFRSGSSYKPLIAFFAYDKDQQDKVKRTGGISAAGDADFNSVSVKDTEIKSSSDKAVNARTLKKYVDENAGSSVGAIAKSGSDENPTLAKGELYLCTSNNTLLVGV